MFQKKKKKKKDLDVLNEQGDCVWLGAVASHLSWVDPFNLSVLFYFKENLFDPILELGDDAESPEAQMRLLEILSCLMCPVAIHPLVKKRWKPKSSQMFGEVPRSADENLLEYNKRVVRLFTSFTATYEAPQELSPKSAWWR
jgi:hypothetical protein